MDELNLSGGIVLFLTTGQKLQYDHSKCEPGKVVLKSFTELKLGKVLINSSESPLYEEDPHADEKGYYEVPAVSLTKECASYDPEYILLWLPNEELFGSWDSDHWDLYVFPETGWSDIADDPIPYINAQWMDYNREVSEYFQPFPDYEFKPGMPF
jgi:hypothetical protein